jgi:NAD(P)-dependent dehydrogenase (short-subunit alcohol dehydrogenase family)
MKVAAVLGVGPGLGAAIARRFAGEGFAVAYWPLHSQDRTTWTLELDLRPAVESL